MYTIETTDIKLARRYRLAQFTGQNAILPLQDRTVTGRVGSVWEDNSTAPKRWIVTIITK